MQRQGSIIRQVSNAFRESRHVSNLWILEDWPAELGHILEKDGALLDAVVDSGGGDILGQTSKMLKAGGKAVCYGMQVRSAYIYRVNMLTAELSVQDRKF